MGWENRPYYRENGRSAGGALHAMLFGTVPVARLSNLEVRAHSTLLIFIALFLLFGQTVVSPWQTRLECAGILIVLLFLHEFGHYLAARRAGGGHDEIVLTPVGGEEPAAAPRRPLPAFLTAAAGPAVNVLVCLLAGIGLYSLVGGFALNPWHPFVWGHSVWPRLVWHLNWIYAVSYLLLLFNLLPLFPLDGGHMLQAVLWAKMGWARSMHAACFVGMTGSVPLIVYGSLRHGILVPLIGASCLVFCFMQRRSLVASTGSALQEEMDFSESLREPPPRRRRRMSRWKRNRLRRLAHHEAAEQDRIDAILAKVSAKGIRSLTWWERRTLHQATNRQRRREMELLREEQ